MTIQDNADNPTPVRRHLRLEDLNQLQIELLAEKFSAEPGVVKVVVRKQWLDIEYDISQLTLERVIAVIEDFGGELSADWWTALKTSWYQKTEEKLRAQLIDDPEP
ncbi:hypothetical protein [Oceanisphaera avium]|uniref:Cation transporter n=1 Tax=Oceanisphaera avium TaxID=1903694 RepID=A0A1Y0CYH8_9GAMM|nr:hypothetical protein [Oceanisphaera avium]ART80359.1 hypothetical protein CBP12_09540 [Oceanisphaera avium]